MSGRAFVDTNVLIYAVGPASPKRKRAEALLRTLPEAVISSQIIAEFVNVCLKKQILSEQETAEAALDWMDVLDYVPITEVIVHEAFAIRSRYGFSWWDSLVVAAALESNCTILYTEDLQAGQVIKRTLRVETPFLNVA